MGFYEDLVEGMKACIGEGKKFATNADMARHCGVQAVQTSRYMNGEREKHLRALGNILDKIGAKLVWDTPTSDASSAHASPQDYMQRIEELERQVEELKSYKIKWEGQLELAKAQAECSSKPKIKDADSTKKETA